MPRYIDAEALKLNVQRYTIPNVDYDGTVSVENAERYFISLLDKAPTEDVVPRSEVVAEVLGKVREEIKIALDSNYKARQEHIDKHFKGTLYVYDNFISLVDGKIQALQGIQDFLVEIEKKYVGE